MATIYIDPTYPGSGSGTIAAPFSSWASVTWTAGNSYLQKAGTTFTTAVGGPGRIGVTTNGTITSRIYIGRYGAGANPKILDYSDAFFNFQGRSYITAEDFEVIAMNGVNTAYGTNCYGSVTASSRSLIIRRCRFVGQYVAGLWCYATAIDQNSAIDILWEDNETDSQNAAHIFFGGDIDGLTIKGNRCYNKSAASNNSSIGCHPHRTTVTTGWTDAGGGVYSRAIGAQSFKTTVPDIYLCNYNATTTLTRNTATPTTPGSNEYGYTGGTLYINVGENPAGNNLVYTYSTISAQILYNKVYDQYDPSGVEGRGIQLDDGTSNVLVRGNLVVRCDQGMDSNMGTGNVFEGNVVYLCRGDGIQAGVNGAKTNVVRNNTIIGSSTAADGIDLGTVGSAANTATNNIISGYVTGIRGLAGSSENYNDIFGATTVRTGGIGVGANSVTTDPQLDANYVAQASGIRTAGSSLGGLDFYGKQFQLPPTIGAVQYQAERSVNTTRTAIDRSTASRSTERRGATV